MKDMGEVSKAGITRKGRYGAQSVDAMIKTWTGNRKYDGTTVTAEDVFAVRQSDKHSVLGKEFREHTIYGRRFFNTCDGFFGMGPRSLKSDDCICLIKGCNVPIILRRSEQMDNSGKSKLHGSGNEDDVSYRVIGPACKLNATEAPAPS